MPPQLSRPPESFLRFSPHAANLVSRAASQTESGSNLPVVPTNLSLSKLKASPNRQRHLPWSAPCGIDESYNRSSCHLAALHIFTAKAVVWRRRASRRPDVVVAGCAHHRRRTLRTGSSYWMFAAGDSDVMDNLGSLAYSLSENSVCVVLCTLIVALGHPVRLHLGLLRRPRTPSSPTSASPSPRRAMFLDSASSAI